MQKSALKLLAVSIIAFIFALTNTYATMHTGKGQEKGEHNGKFREKVDQIKKIKLLEILNLDEAKADKFLAVYTMWDNKVNEQRKALDELSDKMRDALKSNASKDDIAKMNKDFVNQWKEFQNTVNEKSKAVSNILSETEYAKYLIFEHEFPKEIQKILMNRFMKGGRGPRGFKGR
jgi:uncharacterized protein YukE